MTTANTIYAMLQAEIASGRGTKRSIGAFYAMALRFIPADARDRWRPINEAIRASQHRDIRYLEHVKQIAWSIHDAGVADERIARSGTVLSRSEIGPGEIPAIGNMGRHEALSLIADV